MAIPSFKQDVEAQEARVFEEQFDAENQRGLENIYRGFKELVRCDANAGLIAEYCNPLPASLVAFTLAMNNPTFVKSLVWSPIKDQKASLIEEIAELLSRKGGGGFDDHALQAEKKNRLQWQSVDELTDRRDSILRERELRKRPLAEVKQIVGDSVPPVGYPKLPRAFVPSGQFQSVPLDSSYLTNDREIYNRLIRVK
jgi:hypothetical protein